MPLQVLPMEGLAEALCHKCLFDGVGPSLEAQHKLDFMGIEFVIGEACSMKKNATSSRARPKAQASLALWKIEGYAL